MGYYTSYSITVIPETQEEAVLIELANHSDYIFDDGMLYGRWYHWEEDCREVSSKYPESVITVDGVGEENGDQWVAYFKDGKVVKHSMPTWTPPPYNEEDLR